MTQIKRVASINGGSMSQEIIKRLSVQTIIVSPNEVKDYFYKKYEFNFDPYNSVVLFDNETKCIYGYFLTHQKNIPNISFIYKGEDKIIDYLNSSNGLFISNVVLQNEIEGTPLIRMLNTIHLSFCQSDLNKDYLYVWMDLGEVIWSSTKQQDTFFTISLNKVSRTFYDKCI